MANPVPSDKLVDLQSNAQTTDSFVNSDSLTVTARPTPTAPAGKVIKTLAGINADVELALQRIGVQYSDPIADWTALTEITAFEAHRYPATTGDLYIPTAPLPFTTGATFDSGNWTLLQGVNDAYLVNSKAIKKLTDYDDISDWIASSDSSVYLTENYTLPSDITIPKGKKVIVLDGGTFTMTNTSFVWNGEIEAPRKHVFLYNGALNDARITGTPETEEWLSDWFGVIPDGVTDYVATGRMFALPNFSSKTGATVVFTSGLFKCGIDNNQSNTTFRCEPAAIFAGVVHAAINNSGIPNPELNPTNVKWIGKVTTLTRFGTYHCDGVDVEEVLVKDDAANSELGYAGGVHLYKDTKNFSCRKMTIEASKRNFGFGLDSDDQLLPEGCYIGHLEIITTDVLGVYLRAKNSRIDSINIRSWGKGNAAGDPDLSLGLPGETDPAIVLKTYGFYALDCAGVSVGQLAIDGSNFGDIAEHGVLLGDGNVTIEELDVRNSPVQNIKQLAGDHVITSVDSRLAVADGVEQIGGSLSGISLISDFNGGLGYKGAKNLIDLNLSFMKVRTNSNSGAGVDAASVNFNVDSWESKSNGAGVINVTLGSPTGRIGKITTASGGVDTAGGLLVNGGTSQFDFSHDSTNEGYVAGNQYAVYINGGANRRVTGMNIKGSSNQAVRIVGTIDSSIDHLKIPDGAGSGLVVATLTNFSISNSVNTLSTNAAGQVVEFNNVGIT